MTTRTKTKWRPKLEGLEARRLLSVYADFNGDGFDDLAIGVPGENSGAGMVQVLYGGPIGLTDFGNQSWTQLNLGTDTSEPGDNFGAALAGGDFNNDGFTDLAVGIPGEDVGTTVDAGAIHLILGSSSGLTGVGDKVFHQNSNRVRDISEEGDHFGAALAAGDFDGNGFCDLAVGIPYEDVFAVTDTGMVQVLYGAVSGLIPGFSPPWHMNDPSIPGIAQEYEFFGWALAAGDFTADGRDDLAIGIPSRDVSQHLSAGALVVMLGSTTGITAIGSQLRADLLMDNAFLGSALATGDFNGDGFADVAAGAPLATNNGIPSGVVVEYHGHNIGLQTIYSTISGDGSFDSFGGALTAADFNNNGFDDLAIGAPGADVGGNSDAGRVTVMFGSSNTLVPGQVLTQEVLNTGTASEAGDRFGYALSAGDFNGNGNADLAISAPFEDIGSTVIDGGVVFTVNGGMTFTGGKSWGQDTSGIQDVAENNDHFGGGLDSGAGRHDSGPSDFAQLITADYDFDSHINKRNKRGQLRR
jgi:hypothetical protein